MQGRRCLIVGEVAQAHDGSLGLAHAFIDAIADAGADAVKFQTHIAAAESTAAEPWRVRSATQDATRYDYWRRMEFTEEQWRGLQRARRRSRACYSSARRSRSRPSICWTRVGVRAWKVASGEVSNTALLDRMASPPDLPVLLVQRHERPRRARPGRRAGQGRGASADRLAVHVRLSVPAGENRLQSARGLSRALSAVRSACRITPGRSIRVSRPRRSAPTMLEVHVTLSREMFGPDQIVSITTAELRQLVDGVRFIERMLRRRSTRTLSRPRPRHCGRCSPRASRRAIDLPAGTVLRTEHLTLKKPGTGIPERTDGRGHRPPARGASCGPTNCIQESDLEDVP